MPAHIRERGYVEKSWLQRFWESIRPPSSVPSQHAPMNRSQRRMIVVTGAIALPLATAWGVYSYISTAPQRAQEAFNEGMKRLGPNDFKGAVERFSAAIATSESAPAYLQRGTAHMNLGDAGQAVSDWSRAIELDQNLADAYTARGTYYQSTGDTTRALADLDKSIQLVPTVDGYFQRGQLHADRGEYEAAIADFNESIAQRPEAPYVYLARSMAKRALGDEEGYRRDQAMAASLQRSP